MNDDRGSIYDHISKFARAWCDTPEGADDLEKAIRSFIDEAFVAHEMQQTKWRELEEQSQLPIGSESFNLLPGRNELLMATDDALVSEIYFQPNCTATIDRVFHGAKNLMSKGQAPIEIAVRHGPDSNKMTLIPPERFHADLGLSVIVNASQKGKLIVRLYGIKP